MVPVGKVLADKYRLDQQPTPRATSQATAKTSSFRPTRRNRPLAEATSPGGGEVWIDINLSAQYMAVYQGDTIIGDTYVSTGRPGFDTPTGTYYINPKYESDDMEGTIGGEYYNVPAVPVRDVLHGCWTRDPRRLLAQQFRRRDEPRLRQPAGRFRRMAVHHLPDRHPRGDPLLGMAFPNARDDDRRGRLALAPIMLGSNRNTCPTPCGPLTLERLSCSAEPGDNRTLNPFHRSRCGIASKPCSG